jgi:hypothetical protein
LICDTVLKISGVYEASAIVNALRNFACYAHCGENRLHRLQKIKIRQIESTLKKTKTGQLFRDKQETLMSTIV